MKETLDSVGAAVDTHERIGGWFAALGCLVVGVLFFIGPDTLSEEIPRHKAIGIGIFCFGLVFLVALSAKGKAGSRAKNFVLFLAAGTIAGGLGFGTWREARVIQALAQDGEELTLPVQRTVVRNRGRDNQYYEVTLLDGQRRIRLEWDKVIKRGTTMTVLVHPDNASWTAAVPAGSSLVEIADARESRWSTLGMAFFSVVIGLFALSLLWGALVGAPAPDEQA